MKKNDFNRFDINKEGKESDYEENLLNYNQNQNSPMYNNRTMDETKTNHNNMPIRKPRRLSPLNRNSETGIGLHTASASTRSNIYVPDMFNNSTANFERSEDEIFRVPTENHVQQQYSPQSSPNSAPKMRFANSNNVFIDPNVNSINNNNINNSTNINSNIEFNNGIPSFSRNNSENLTNLYYNSYTNENAMHENSVSHTFDNAAILNTTQELSNVINNKNNNNNNNQIINQNSPQNKILENYKNIKEVIIDQPLIKNFRDKKRYDKTIQAIHINSHGPGSQSLLNELEYQKSNQRNQQNSIPDLYRDDALPMINFLSRFENEEQIKVSTGPGSSKPNIENKRTVEDEE